MSDLFIIYACLLALFAALLAWALPALLSALVGSARDWLRAQRVARRGRGNRRMLRPFSQRMSLH